MRGLQYHPQPLACPIRAIRKKPYGMFVRSLRVAGGQASSAKVLARDLVKIVEETNRGLDVTSQQRQAIEEYVNKLQALQEGQTTTGDDMSATWKLLWTTEKETLFIVKNAQFFRKKATDVFQVIDKDQGSLQNVITFEPASLFCVDSTLDVTSPQRVNFRFTRARYQEDGKPPVGIPPFGKGWFENVYLDEDTRIAKDIRKDILIVSRDGPPHVF